MYQIVDESRVQHLPTGVVFSLPPAESYGHDYARWLAAGNTPLPAPAAAPAELFAAATAAAQRRLDAFAQARGYDSILSLCTYASDPDPVYAAEGQAGVVARSTTWAALRSLRDAVLAGTRPMPVAWAEVEAELPPLEWT